MTRFIQIVLAGLMATTYFYLGHPVSAETEEHKTAGEIFKASHSAIVEVRKTNAVGQHFRGTGFFVAPNIVATNHHAINNATKILIRESGGRRTFDVLRVIKSDPVGDVALVEVRQQAGTILPLAVDAGVEIGDPVYVIGNMQGYSASFSQGIISGIRTQGGIRVYQITANISGGSSGSPLINAAGQVIAIVYGRLREEAQIGFATPVQKIFALERGLAGGESRARRNTADAGQSAPERVTLREPAKKPSSIGSVGAVQIGVIDADSAAVTAYMLKALIEELLHLPVALIPSTHREIFAELARPDGVIDIHPDVWLPNHRGFIRSEVRLNKLPYRGVQGICVPRYVREQYSISRLVDLANTGISRLFDAGENGKGEIWLGPSGWQSTEINRLKARDYGFSVYFDLRTEPEAKFYSRLDAAYAGRLPIVFHCYGPHWMFRKYDLVQLQEPAHSKTCFSLAAEPGTEEWFRDSRASCREPPTSIHVAFAARLAWQQPQLAALLAHVAFAYEDINEMTFTLTRSRSRAIEAARAWAKRVADDYRPIDRLIAGDHVEPFLPRRSTRN